MVMSFCVPPPGVWSVWMEGDSWPLGAASPTWCSGVKRAKNLHNSWLCAAIQPGEVRIFLQICQCLPCKGLLHWSIDADGLLTSGGFRGVINLSFQTSS